jgi:hypothetical protein
MINCLDGWRQLLPQSAQLVSFALAFENLTHETHVSHILNLNCIALATVLAQYIRQKVKYVKGIKGQATAKRGNIKHTYLRRESIIVSFLYQIVSHSELNLRLLRVLGRV